MSCPYSVQLAGTGRELDVEPLISGPAARHTHMQIIPGEGGGPGLSIGIYAGALEGEDALETGVLRGSKCGGLLRGQGAQLAAALADRGRGDGLCDARRAGSRAARIRKNVEIAERQSFDEFEGAAVVLGGFAGKTADDVCAKAGAGQALGRE